MILAKIKIGATSSSGGENKRRVVSFYFNFRFLNTEKYTLYFYQIKNQIHTNNNYLFQIF